MNSASKIDQLEKRKQQVLDKVTIVDLLACLRVDYNTGRKVHCIFPGHQEKTASMVVYEHTNSVYCFGCQGSGDVVRITQVCVPTSGKIWPLERALSWLEEEFDLPQPTALDSLSAKIGRTLKQGKAEEVKKKTTLARQQAIDLIDKLLEDLQAGRSLQARVALGAFEDYLFDELERPGVDVIEWSVWAKKIVNSYYSKQLSEFDEWVGSEEFLKAKSEIEEEYVLLENTHLNWDERVGSNLRS